VSTRSAANLGLEYCSGSVQGIAGEQHALDALIIPAPLFDLVVRWSAIRADGAAIAPPSPVVHNSAMTTMPAISRLDGRETAVVSSNGA
jgi:hypothetical protein